MNLTTSYSLFTQLKTDIISLVYLGEFNDSMTDQLLSLIQTCLINKEEPHSGNKKLSYLTVECFQNIFRHEDKPEIVHDSNNIPGMFMARNLADTFFITTANLVEMSKVENLKEKIDSINKLSDAALKKLYLEILANEELTEKGGAGLGMIDMVRKSGEKLDFDFKKVNYYHAIFYMQLKLKSKIAKAKKARNINIPIENAKAIHQQLVDNNIFIVFNGNFTQAAVMTLVNMIEQNITSKTDDIGEKKKIAYVIIELIQNILIHGLLIDDVRQGIFTMGIQGDQYFISTGNIISNENILTLTEQLDLLNNKSKAELTKMYKVALLKEDDNKSKGAGIGLIDIARYSSDNLEYGFKEINNEMSYYSITVKI